jgi:hypothetical protein
VASMCISCGAPITWAVSSATGKKMPIDAEPHHDGNIVLTDGTAQVVAAAARAALPAGTLRYRSHFVTCPNAAGWRARDNKPKGGGARG